MALRRTRPPESLSRELLQVAEYAEALGTAVHQANVLPQDFPVEQIEAICGSLSTLPEGTAEGCRLPLEYARSRLPAMRREFLPVILPHDTDATGAPDRGSVLDSAIVNLIGAVTTALDEYRYLATSAFEDSDAQDYAEPITDKASRRKIEAQSLKTAEYLATTTKTAAEILEIESEKSADFIRSLHDASQLNDLARAETSMPTVVVRWLGTLSKGLTKLPAAIRKIGETIETGADVANIGWDRWDSFWSELRDFGLKQISETGRAFQSIADRLEKRHRRRTEGAENVVPDDRAEFSEWLLTFVRSRDQNGRGVATSLIAAEIFQRYNYHGTEFAKRFGLKNLKALIMSTTELRVIGSSGEQFAVLMSEEEHIARRNKVAMSSREVVLNVFHQLNMRALARGDENGVPIEVLHRSVAKQVGHEFLFLWGTSRPTTFRQYLQDYFVIELAMNGRKAVGITSIEIRDEPAR